MNATLVSEERAAAVRAWNQAFDSTDAFGWPFSTAVNFGRVLFPTDGCQLSREQFDALARVAAKRGETTCYLAVVEGHVRLEANADQRIFMISLADYESYASLYLTLENAIYSTSGDWGILLSHEMHAVLGGDAVLVSEFNQLDTSAAEQWKAFQGQWCAEKHKEWVAQIASHVLNSPGD